MAITSIKRDEAYSPFIVRILSSNTLAEVGTANYLLGQADEIRALNEGDWQWEVSDMVLVYASDGWGFFQLDADFESLTPFAFSGSVIGSALPSAEILVGSAGGLAAAVAVTGDIAISNAGVTSIASGVIVNADINAAAAIAFSKLATLASGNLLVGSAGGVATSVAMSGDISIIASGATAIGANKVLSSMVSPLLQKYATVAITAAEFNGMYAAPKLLLAAGGADTLIVVDKVELLMTYVSANYAAGGVAAVQYDSTANGAGVIASTTLSAATFQAAASTGFVFNGGVVPQTFSTTVNKGLYLSNITGAFTTGDSTFVAHIWYKVIPTV